ncbi:DUF3592 domain-containing protein [Vineibacter terrae]|uniref:DUF3592 domain-containing protein n=1 Tax=Vineibacter terrae TaxID=2586908 RepID=UPI002E33FE12|nr:DUF3592 domain-containing protein [Vineibacter terrae]HEX2888449.1 DUF3592 domain-containing protein [Vineibacter terrae]
MGVNWPWLLGMLALPGVLAAMILWICWQNWRTRHWHTTIGRIVESRSTSRDVLSRSSRLVHGSEGGRATVVTAEQIDRKNFADIAYEYTIAGKTFLSRRVGLGADHGNLDVVALLQRYPKGKAVTVHYDPASPGDSILQRDDPRRLRTAWLGVALLAAMIVGGFLAFDHVLAFLEARVGNPRRMPLITFALVAALFVALLAWAMMRRARVMRAWPTAQAVVVASRVERTMTRRTRGTRRTTTPVYVPRVIYRFRIDGVDIDGDQLGRMMRSTRFEAAERFAMGFPVGKRLVVHYDPDEPTTAVVEPTTGMLPLVLLAISVSLGVIACALAVL